MATVVIGLGGTGVRAIRGLLKLRKELGGGEEWDNVHFLAIDSDSGLLGSVTELENNEKLHLTGNINQISKWPDVKEFLNIGRGSNDYKTNRRGANGIRPLGRALLYSMAGDVRKKIENSINNAASVTNKDSGAGVLVVIVSSLAGGTGSGIFLDVAYTVRHLANIKGNSSITLNGVFLLPEFFEQQVAAAGYIYSNTYAALRELNHYMYTKRYGLSQRFDVKSEARINPIYVEDDPFDYVYLYTNSSINSNTLTPNEGHEPLIERLLSLSIYNLAIGDTSNNVLSTLNNVKPMYKSGQLSFCYPNGTAMLSIDKQSIRDGIYSLIIADKSKQLDSHDSFVENIYNDLSSIFTERENEVNALLKKQLQVPTVPPNSSCIDALNTIDNFSVPDLQSLYDSDEDIKNQTLKIIAETSKSIDDTIKRYKNDDKQYTYADIKEGLLRAQKDVDSKLAKLKSGAETAEKNLKVQVSRTKAAIEKLSSKVASKKYWALASTVILLAFVGFVLLGQHSNEVHILQLARALYGLTGIAIAGFLFLVSVLLWIKPVGNCKNTIRNFNNKYYSYYKDYSYNLILDNVYNEVRSHIVKHLDDYDHNIMSIKNNEHFTNTGEPIEHLPLDVICKLSIDDVKNLLGKNINDGMTDDKVNMLIDNVSIIDWFSLKEDNQRKECINKLVLSSCPLLPVDKGVLNQSLQITLRIASINKDEESNTSVVINSIAASDGVGVGDINISSLSAKDKLLYFKMMEPVPVFSLANISSYRRQYETLLTDPTHPPHTSPTHYRAIYPISENRERAERAFALGRIFGLIYAKTGGVIADIDKKKYVLGSNIAEAVDSLIPTEDDLFPVHEKKNKLLDIIERAVDAKKSEFIRESIHGGNGTDNLHKIDSYIKELQRLLDDGGLSEDVTNVLYSEIHYIEELREEIEQVLNKSRAAQPDLTNSMGSSAPHVNTGRPEPSTAIEGHDSENRINRSGPAQAGTAPSTDTIGADNASSADVERPSSLLDNAMEDVE